MRRRAIAFFLIAAGLLAPLAAAAGESADATRQALESGAFAEGERALADRVAATPGDDEARLGLGMVRFAEAIERFGQAQYRYGLGIGRLGVRIGVAFQLLPVNPAPQPLSYEQQRANLQALLDDVAQVETTLAPMGETKAKVTLDLNRIQFHFSGPGPADPGQTLGAILAQATAPSAFRPAPATPSPAGPFEATFDRADALWLRAYAHVLSAGLEFALAYDWRDSFDRYAGFFYSGAKSAKPYEGTRPGPLGGASGVETDIADAIGFVHSIHWRCVEPDRMRRAREHFKAVVALNRQMWPIILARADDDKNWIPGPQQKNAAMPALQVTEAKVKAWRDAVELFDALLDGTKLLPHWRYQWGIDLNAFFQQPGDFDLAYWLTGPGAAPYLRAGPTIGRQEWNDLQTVFGGSFLTYLVWFN
jgi:hypothetical protein